MKTAVQEWIESSRIRLQSNTFTTEDLDQLEELTSSRRQSVLYLSSQSTNMRSPIAAWVLIDPSQPYAPQVPSQEPPYNSVLEAVADGWRIVQFPIAKLYEYREVDNDYIGYEFILEDGTERSVTWPESNPP